MRVYICACLWIWSSKTFHFCVYLCVCELSQTQTQFGILFGIPFSPHAECCFPWLRHRLPVSWSVRMQNVAVILFQTQTQTRTHYWLENFIICKPQVSTLTCHQCWKLPGRRAPGRGDRFWPRHRRTVCMFVCVCACVCVSWLVCMYMPGRRAPGRGDRSWPRHRRTVCVCMYVYVHVCIR